MNDSARKQSPGWWSGLVALVIATMGIAWVWDHRQQQTRLEPQRVELSAKQETLEHLRVQLIQTTTFDGYDDWDEIEWCLDHVLYYQVFEGQAASFTRADDPLYHEAVPKLIALLDDESERRRQGAWRLLQQARKSPRFEQYVADYERGVINLLHHRSILAYNKLLPWLREKQLRTPEVLDGLRQRMMNDDDPFAPQAAYTLAELDPTVDIGPRLVELIERKHERWESILHQLPKYLPEEEAIRIFQAHRPDR